MLATAMIRACGTTSLTAASTGATGGSPGLPIDFGAALAVYGAAVAIFTIGILMVVALALMVRRIPPAVAVPAGAVLSPDGHYWWDGATWRPVR